MDFISKNIQKARKQLKISQVQMADNLNCSQSAITSIERGVKNGSLMLKYILFLKEKGISVDWIFSDHD